jgi:hypothetical protein
LVVDIERDRDMGLLLGVAASHGFLLWARYGPI